MKNFLTFLLIFLALAGRGWCQELTAQEIMERVDKKNEAQDRFSSLKMRLINREGKESVRELKLWTKGDDKRLIKFLSPADVKGSGFLVLNAGMLEEKMYLYLPELKKVRRIAGGAKRGSFMGSDFTYNEIGRSKYSKDYEGKRLPDEGGNYVLELNKKPKSEADYDRLKVWVASDSFVPVRVEFYSLRQVAGKENYDLMKIMTAEKIGKFGKYSIPQLIQMEDVKKNHKTILEMIDIKLDSGLPDSIFSERNLQR